MGNQLDQSYINCDVQTTKSSYFKDVEFIWDDLKHGKNVKLISTKVPCNSQCLQNSVSDRLETIHEHSANDSLCYIHPLDQNYKEGVHANRVRGYGKNWGIAVPRSLSLTAKRCNIFEFEIKIDYLYRFGHPPPSVMMGFMFKSYITENIINYDNNLIYDNIKQAAVQFGYKQKNFILHGRNRVCDKIESPFKFQCGDTCKLRVNFIKKHIELYYNGNYVGIILKKKSGTPSIKHIRTVPFVALRNAQISILSARCVLS